MALFGKKDKKLSLDEILASIESLSEEDKNKLKAAIGGEDKKEDKDTDSVDAEKTDIEEVKDGTTTGKPVDTDELEDDSAVEEIEDTKDVSDTEEKVEETETVEEVAEPTKDEPNTEEPVVEVDAKTDENADVGERLATRVAELEKFISKVAPLVELMEEYTKKEAKRFGYEGQVPGLKKDDREMTTDELAKSLISEI